MPTIRQQKLAENLIENLKSPQPKTAGEILKNTGYSPLVSEKNSTKIIANAGVQKALEDRGLTEENAKRVVSEILNKGRKEEARLKAADMVFKVRGTYAPDKSLNLNVNTDVQDFTKYDDISSKFDEEMKRKMLE